MKKQLNLAFKKLKKKKESVRGNTFWLPHSLRVLEGSKKRGLSLFGLCSINQHCDL